MPYVILENNEVVIRLGSSAPEQAAIEVANGREYKFVEDN
jgi:hypothetical protein